MPSLKEAERITGTGDPGGIAACLHARGVRTVVVKLGDKGCFVQSAGRPGFLVDAFPTDVVDTTGAGDSFVAGFLTGVLRKWDLKECATFACAVAALNIRRVGATAGIPTYDEARRFMQQRKG